MTILLVLAFGLWVVSQRDVAWQDDSDLRQVRPNIPVEENAYTHFLRASEAIVVHTNGSIWAKYAKGQEITLDEVSDFVQRNRETFRLVDQGNACRIFLAPEATVLDAKAGRWFAWVMGVQTLTDALAKKARVERLASLPADSAASCAALLRFADLLDQHADRYAGVHTAPVWWRGLAETRDLARDGRADVDTLRTLGEVLDGLHPLENGFVWQMKGEYQFVAAAINGVRQGVFSLRDLELGWGTRVGDLGSDWIPSYAFNAGATKLLYASFCRDAIQNAARCYAEVRSVAPETVLGRIGGGTLSAVRPNALGRLLVGERVSDGMGLAQLAEVRVEVAATRLVVALQRFRRQEGRSPTALTELVPAFLEAVPADPFDGQPFRYVPEKGIVYSVGKDLKDGGGDAPLPPPGTAERRLSGRRDPSDLVYWFVAPSPEPAPQE